MRRFKGVLSTALWQPFALRHGFTALPAARYALVPHKGATRGGTGPPQLRRSSMKGAGMAKAYWVARVDVSDPDAYKKYIEANAEAFRAYGARFIVRGGRFECKEGAARQRNVVIEFDSYEKALHSSWVAKELKLVRNAQPAVARWGGYLGTLYAGIDM